jgi:hypothetical protein
MTPEAAKTVTEWLASGALGACVGLALLELTTRYEQISLNLREEPEDRPADEIDDIWKRAA